MCKECKPVSFPGGDTRTTRDQFCRPYFSSARGRLRFGYSSLCITSSCYSCYTASSCSSYTASSCSTGFLFPCCSFFLSGFSYCEQWFVFFMYSFFGEECLINDTLCFLSELPRLAWLLRSQQ